MVIIFLLYRIETKTLAIFLHCRSNFICLLCSYPRKLTNIICNIFARKFCNVGWKVVRWSRDASAPVSDDQALTKLYLNLSIFPNINSIYLNANPLRITHRNKTLLLSTRSHCRCPTWPSWWGAGRWWCCPCQWWDWPRAWGPGRWWRCRCGTRWWRAGAPGSTGSCRSCWSHSRSQHKCQVHLSHTPRPLKYRNSVQFYYSFLLRIENGQGCYQGAHYWIWSNRVACKKSFLDWKILFTKWALIAL